MDVVVAVVALAPVLLLLVLLILRVRQLWPRRPVTWIIDPPKRGDAAGVREPRRPLIPTRTGGVALALPEAESRPDPSGDPHTHQDPEPGHGLRAS